MAIEETQVIQEQEQEEKLKGELELKDKLTKYLQTKQIINELREENKMLLEDLEYEFLESGEDEQEVYLEDGSVMLLTKYVNIKEVLDKDSLAHDLLIAKDEIKTPFDFSMLTSQGKLTPKMISEHTNTETIVKMKIKKKSSKGRRRRK